jgi:23S rRNA (adenine2503-C2)-methyltransferase
MAFKDVVANGDAGLQLSINTTDSAKRNELFHGNAMELEDISSVMYDALLHGIKGRKITLNFALTDAPIDAKYLRRLFNPEYFLCKITPMHVTKSSNEHNLITHDGYESYYPYKATEEALKNEGFDVIVFIPSKEEDESKITCGNAILAEKDQLFN